MEGKPGYFELQKNQDVFFQLHQLPTEEDESDGKKFKVSCGLNKLTPGGPIDHQPLPPLRSTPSIMVGCSL